MASMMETDIVVATTNGAAAPSPVATPPSQVSRANDRLADALKLEHQLIKVSLTFVILPARNLIAFLLFQ